MFIFTEVPDRLSKEFYMCSAHFTLDSFTNKTQFDAGFAERLIIKVDAVPTILGTTEMSQHTSVSLYTLKNKGASRCHRRTYLSKWLHKEPLTSEEPFCFTKGSLWRKKVLQIIKR